MQGQGRLDQSRGAGGGLGMTDLGLDRADSARWRIRLAEYLAQGFHFDGVADFGAGAVTLDQADAGRLDGGLLIGSAQGFLLAGRTRFIDGGAAAVARCADSLDHRIDLVAVPFGVGQPFHHQNAEPFAESGAIGIGVEGAGMAGRREGRGLAETGVHENVVKGVNASGDDHVGLARGQFQRSQIEGAQGTAAGGIADAVGAAKVEMLADASGDHVAEQPGKGIFLPGDVGFGNPLDGVVGGGVVNAGFLHGGAPDWMAEPGAEGNDQFEGAGNAEDDADPFPVEFLAGAVAGIFQGLADGHQAEELGGVDGFQGVRQDAVLHGVKSDGRKKSAMFRIDPVRRFRVFVEIVFRPPVAFGNLGDGIHAVFNIGPEFADVIGLRKKAADADDCQRRSDGRILAVLFDTVCFQRRYSLMVSISRGAKERASASRRTPWMGNWLARSR